MRLAAARAFHEADASQALRNALHAGARPVRNFETAGIFLEKGGRSCEKGSALLLARTREGYPHGITFGGLVDISWLCG